MTKRLLAGFLALGICTAGAAHASSTFLVLQASEETPSVMALPAMKRPAASGVDRTEISTSVTALGAIAPPVSGETVAALEDEGSGEPRPAPFDPSSMELRGALEGDAFSREEIAARVSDTSVRASASDAVSPARMSR